MKWIVLIFCLVIGPSLIAQNELILENQVKAADRKLDKEDLVRSENKKRLIKAFNIKEDTIQENVDSIFGLKEIKDDRIDLLINDYIENKKIKGYRIQIFLSSTKWEAIKTRSEFLKKYQEEKSYLIYQAPNFKVRVGNYQDRLIAQEHLDLIKIDFPSAFIVKDEIEIKIE